MCGIVGYTGSRSCVPILVDGLRRLEYRGYDSAGLAVLTPDEADSTRKPKLSVLRTVGKLSRLDEALSRTPLTGSVGLGHTRWATHGRAAVNNAHPHVAGDVAVIHNGILENHLELRAEILAAGRSFSSETDTEVAAHLIDMELLRGAPSLLEATKRALKRVRGAYALAIVSSRFPDTIVVAKSASPLVIGLGEGETFAASDVPALLPHTRSIIFLEDGDAAELRPGSVRIERIHDEGAQGEPAVITRPIKHIDWSPAQAEKQGFKHFMLKEIHEQPTAVENTLRGHLAYEHMDFIPDGIGISPEQAAGIQRIILIACGTSFHASMVGRAWIENFSKIPTEVDLASEFRYRDLPLGPSDLVIAVSQSGETADTLAAVHDSRNRGATVLSIVNVLGSAIARAAHGTLYTYAGPEIGVASTKCFTAELVALFMLAVFLGKHRKTLSAPRATELLQYLIEVPKHMRHLLKSADEVRAIARKQLVSAHVHDCLFLGRGLSYAVALEGALKLKEISYIHAEGYAAGEMKHGPIALIDAQMPVVVIAPRDRLYEKIASNVQEVAAREGRIIAVVTEGDQAVSKLADDIIFIPAADELISPLLSVVPLQLLAYYTADFKGTDIDQPRNLAKTVTVE